jgi:hypothetical protein
MRHVSIFLAAALPAVLQAAPAYQPTLSGDQFVSMLAQQPKDAFGYRQRERAYAYVDGVQDAAAGTTWCAPQPVKTDELAYSAADYIKTLHADLRRGNAAPLLLAFLAHLHPCKGALQ